MNNVKLLGTTLRPYDMQSALERTEEMIISETGGMIFTPNATMLYNASRSPQDAEILSSADVCLCDGVGVTQACRIIEGRSLPRVCGVDFGERVAQLCARRGYSLYLLGGKRGVAEQAAARLQKKYKGLIIAGTHHGYYEKEWQLLSEIALASPDVLFVCLGSPRQERFIYYNRRILPHCVMLGLGGSLDIYSGEKKRAPKIFRRLGLEWAYRLSKERDRIKKSHLLAFSFAVLKERFCAKVHKNSDKRERKKVKS